jgi:hypothetical protein
MTHPRRTLNRRLFLKAASVLMAAVPLGRAGAYYRQSMIAVPPSIMLHARQDHLSPAGLQWQQ